MPWTPKINQRVEVIHEDVWKAGVLTRVAGEWAVRTTEPLRTRYVFCGGEGGGKLVLQWIVRRPRRA